MNKFAYAAIATSAALLSHTALAQSQVVVYGLIDTGIEYVTNANAAGNSVIKMPSLTGSFPSRIGFKGTEDLGGGLQAMFVLEAGLAVDTGAMGQGNRLFGRQSYVGLKNAGNSVMLGRQVNMTYLSTFKSDVMGPNIHSIGNLDAYLPNARSDNSIGYLGTFSDVTVGATYSFGRDASAAGGPAATNCAGEVAGDSKACRQMTALLGYDNKAFGVNLAYDTMNGNTNATGGLNNSSYTDRRIGVHGYFMVGDTRIGLGVLDRKTQTAVNSDSDLYYLGVSYPFLTAWVLDAQVSRLKFNGTSNVSTLSVARLTYNLSRRTALYTSVGYIKNGGNAAIAVDAGGTVGVGMNQLGIMTGVRHTF
ncbi:porin [Herbaspirillum autotrophicum]|uniref:porin n=1 Tax=Herbaspirillum autotrophicum TaxID=180195 RepID=UPI00067CA2B1|nr:porin [Herbaspirillum autotrophicum]